jgi:hypothetical protein
LRLVLWLWVEGEEKPPCGWRPLPWEPRRVESRDRPAEKVGLPRAFLARMISSKRRMEGFAAG